MLSRALRPVQSSISQASKRGIHTVPKLPNFARYSQDGIKGLYSAGGFNTAWTQYQKFVVDKLNELTIETENETRVPFQILLNTARKSDQAHVFNHASQAYNNHLFFEALTDADTNKTEPSRALLQKINQTFGDLDGLRQEILFEADTLMGYGWVFLVEAVDKNLHIMSSYNAGSPFTASRAQMFDLNNAVSEKTEEDLEIIKSSVDVNEKNYAIPLLAVNVWEHAYLPDYSFNGKADYLENWWKAIDWNVVSSRYFPGA